ncbi:MAG: 50S ribosomal protein L18 [Candidatus Azambacteria bacterium]|nr:50S ribosomal protein L18 [Candidatus Azambacteria bacterium]
MATRNKNTKRIARHKRIRAKIFGTSERPRLSVFKSNKYIYAQLIDDENGKTLVASFVLDKGVKSAYNLGESLAKKATDKKIKKVVFDRGGYKFHGKILELAKGAREGGLIF